MEIFKARVNKKTVIGFIVIKWKHSKRVSLTQHNTFKGDTSFDSCRAREENICDATIFFLSFFHLNISNWRASQENMVFLRDAEKWKFPEKRSWSPTLQNINAHFQQRKQMFSTRKDVGAARQNNRRTHTHKYTRILETYTRNLIWYVHTLNRENN